MTAEKHKCVDPDCNYSSPFKAAVMNHIIGHHPGKWLGNWDATYGVPGATPGRSRKAIRNSPTVKRKQFGKWDAVDQLLAKSKRKPMTERQREIRNRAQKRMRAANIAKGLTSGGKPRKMPLREAYLQRHGMAGTPVAVPKKTYPSNTNEYKRAKYRERRDKYHAMGLDARGRPLKSGSTQQALINMQNAQQARRAREAQEGFKRMKPIVYHASPKTPEQPDAITILMNHLRDQLSYKLNRCPNCGLDLVPLKEAMMKQQIEQMEKEQREEKQNEQ